MTLEQSKSKLAELYYSVCNKIGVVGIRNGELAFFFEDGTALTFSVNEVLSFEGKWPGTPLAVIGEQFRIALENNPNLMDHNEDDLL